MKRCTKLGAGAVAYGYYMYHGGTNPDGKLSTFQESQASGSLNDLPLKGYDYQAPLGEFGQVHPVFSDLKILHLFLHDFGAQLAHTSDGLRDAHFVWYMADEGQTLLASLIHGRNVRLARDQGLSLDEVHVLPLERVDGSPSLCGSSDRDGTGEARRHHCQEKAELVNWRSSH
jgi:hypothetical protein